ncbi:MAG: helix-turn-helix domain-containing protein [Hyphomicrobiaceae bacterium]
MSNDDTKRNMEVDHLGMTPDDWARHDALTDEEITRRALSDPDNPPLSPEQLARVRRPALAKRIRNKLRMTRETFARNYGIPVDTLRAWERHEAEPTPTEIAYLRLIEREPERAMVVPAEYLKGAPR